MKNEIITGIASTIAGASLIGGGTMVLNAHKDNAVQDRAIANITQEQQALRADLGVAVKELTTATRDLDRNVAILNERVDRKE